MAYRAAALSLLAATALFAAPTLDQGQAEWVLRNEHLALHFGLDQGGFLTRVDAFGQPLILGGTAYTDHGLYGDLRLRVASDQRPGTLEFEKPGTVVSTGDLTTDGEQSPGPVITYRLTVTLGDEAEFGLRVELFSDREMPQATGFLAMLFRLPAISEWWARTVDGRINELAEEHQRLYQSANEPLDPERPELGLLFPDGRRLIVLDARAEAGPLSNVFLHHAEEYTALFLAWLDAGRGADWHPDEPWVITARMRCEPAP